MGILKFKIENNGKFLKPKNGDAGFDLYANSQTVLKAHSQELISTGLYLEIPENYVGIIKDRSSMASKRLYTHGGVIDSSYRGEVKIILSNETDEDYLISQYDRIAQLVVIPCLTVTECQQVDVLEETERGEGGFGSTGK